MFHINATVAPKLTLAGFIALFAKEPPAGQQGITLLTTWSPVALLQPELLSPKNWSGYSVRTGKDQMASCSARGIVASRYVTVTCPLAESYLSRATQEAGAAAETAASRKEEKYVDFGAHYVFEPIAVESSGVFNAPARHLLDDLGRRILLNSGEARETSYLYQSISVLVQRLNTVLVRDSLPATEHTAL